MIGKTISQYKILQILGSGGMGSVYLVEDMVLGRKAALKIVNPILTTNNQFTERFIKEARLQASLLHPNIVTLYNFFQEQEKYCIVMEYVKGETLKDLIKRTGLIPEKRAIKIFKQLLDALGYAHSRGIIHRDIKPSNILIDLNDNVQVMDFGIAKIIGDKGLTKTGANLGTVYYMSPEQVIAKDALDNRTDIYSLGITLFEMLTAKIPVDVDTKSDFEVMRQIVEKDFVDPREFYPHINQNTVNLLCKCLEKDRDKRFESCSEITSFLDVDIILVDDRNTIPNSIVTKEQEVNKFKKSIRNTHPEETVNERHSLRKEKPFDLPETKGQKTSVSKSQDNGRSKKSQTPNSGKTKVIAFVIVIILAIAGIASYFLIFQDNESIKSETDIVAISDDSLSQNEMNTSIASNDDKQNKETDEYENANTSSSETLDSGKKHSPDLIGKESSVTTNENESGVNSLPIENSEAKITEETRYPIITSLSHVRAIRKLNSGVKAVAFGSGNTIAIGGDDSKIILLDAVNNSLKVSLVTDYKQTLCLAFSSDGKYLASGHQDDLVRLWDIQNQKLLFKLKEHFYSITSVAFSPNNQMLASASDDGFINLWDVSKGNRIIRIKTGSSVLKSICFTPDGKNIIGASDNNVISYWEATTGTKTFSFKATNSSIYAISVSPNGALIAIGCLDKTASVFSLSSGKLIRTYKGHTSRVAAVDFSEDSNFLFTAGYDSKIIVWDIVTRDQITSIKAHSHIINSLSVSKNGKYLISGSDDRSVKLWKINY